MRKFSGEALFPSHSLVNKHESCWFPFFIGEGGGGQEEISALKANLEIIASKLDDLAQTTEFQAYSYGFNVKTLVYRNVWAKSLLCKLVICVLRSSTDKMDAEVTIPYLLE